MSGQDQVGKLSCSNCSLSLLDTLSSKHNVSTANSGGCSVISVHLQGEEQKLHIYELVTGITGIDSTHDSRMLTATVAFHLPGRPILG